jgi:HD domain
VSAATGRTKFGTLAWARAKDGRLSRAEEVQEIARATAALLRVAPAQLRERLGLKNRRALAYDPARIRVPDSQMAREAEQLCREASSETLVNHCLRTYVFGMLLGIADGLKPDEELLYVGSLLHDLALTDSFREHAPMPCFAARGALAATGWAAERGWGDERCARLGDAISLHLNSRVPDVHGPEAQLLRAGAGLDVIGMRHWDLAPQTVAAVLALHPRAGFKRSYGTFRHEARPDTRMGLLDRRLAFGALVRHSQFAD